MSDEKSRELKINYMRNNLLGIYELPLYETR